MHDLFKALAAAAAMLAVPSFAQSVEIKTGPNGTMSGKAEAGDVSSSVGVGQTPGDRAEDESRASSVATGRCAPGTRTRSVRVVSPDGSSSSSSSSVSVGGGGTVSVAGGGSPGTRISEGGCGDGGRAYDAGRTASDTAAGGASRHPIAHRPRAAHRRTHAAGQGVTR